MKLQKNYKVKRNDIHAYVYHIKKDNFYKIFQELKGEKNV